MTQASVSAPRWSGSAVLAAAVVVAWLGIHLLVPALALFGQRPAPFAWQMYSSLPQLPEAWIVKADGTTGDVDIHELFTVPRAEIDYAAVLREQLCEATDAVAVLIQPAGTDQPERIECR